MHKIEDNLNDYLNRINFIFKNEEIYTNCTKNYDGFAPFGEKFSFEKGKNYKLKFFIAKIFIENNILEIATNEKCDNIDVQRFAIAERDDPKIMQQGDYFLNKIKEFKAFLEMDVKDGKKPLLDLDRFNSYLSDLIGIRLLKLLRLSKTEISIIDERNLTFSEKKLYDGIYKFIFTWRKFFLSKNKGNNSTEIS